MKDKIQSFKTRFKEANTVAQIIRIYRELVKFTKTESPKNKDLSAIVEVAQNNNYHPEKEFEINESLHPDRWNPNGSFWKEWEKIQQFPSEKLSSIHRHCEYLNKENSNMADKAAYRHCKDNNLRMYVCKATGKHTKHYNDAWSKAFKEYSKDNTNKATQRLLDQEREVRHLESELLQSHKINQLRKKYGDQFRYLLKYGIACMERNGFNGKNERPSIKFFPKHIELAETITFTSPKTTHHHEIAATTSSTNGKFQD